jgi:hypothetical protein
MIGIIPQSLQLLVIGENGSVLIFFFPADFHGTG